jgi:hypothetical protein
MQRYFYFICSWLTDLNQQVRVIAEAQGQEVEVAKTLWSIMQRSVGALEDLCLSFSGILVEMKTSLTGAMIGAELAETTFWVK